MWTTQAIPEGFDVKCCEKVCYVLIFKRRFKTQKFSALSAVFLFGWSFICFVLVWLFISRNVHHKRNRMTPVMPLPWQLPRRQSLSLKKQIYPFATLLSGAEGLAQNRHGSGIVSTLLIRLLGVDGTWLWKKLQISILIMATASQVSF